MEKYGQTTHKSTKQTVRKIATGKSSGLRFGEIADGAFLRSQISQTMHSSSSASSQTEETTGIASTSRST